MRGQDLTRLLLLAGLLLLSACAPSSAVGAHFRSEQFHVEVDLPRGWGAAEGPLYLARPFTGWVAFNSWGEDGFWATEVVTETAQGVQASYGPVHILGQLPSDGAYVALVYFGGGPVQAPDEIEPDYEQRDLAALLEGTDPREGEIHPGVTYIFFNKWGRRMRLEIYVAPEASDATVAELTTLLESWRFDEVPAGDVGWATFEARKALPASVEPEKFPVLGGGPDASTSQQDDIVRTTAAEHLQTTPGTKTPDATVVVTFTYRWDAPQQGPLSDECPPDRCHWWRVEARPNGEVVLVQEGGAHP